MIPIAPAKQAANSSWISTVGIFAGWLLVYASVQPWDSSGMSQRQDGITPGQGALWKGFVLLAIAAIALIRAGRLPTKFSAWHLAYVGFAIVALAGGVYSGTETIVAMRALRLCVLVLLPLVLWSRVDASVRADLGLKIHRMALAAMSLSVALGAVLWPEQAWTFLGDGSRRIVGVVPPLHSNRVGETVALLAGLYAIALAYRKVRLLGWLWLILGSVLLLASKSRTALLGLAVALIVTLVLHGRARPNRRMLGIVVISSILVMAFASGPAMAWMQRGQDASSIATLTGRTRAWQAAIDETASFQQAFLGHGLGAYRITLSHDRIQAIDNGWVAAYWQTGLLGVAALALAMMLALRLALGAPTPLVRTACTFIVLFVLMSSVAETGISDAWSHVLHLSLSTWAAWADRLAAGERA